MRSNDKDKQIQNFDRKRAERSRPECDEQVGARSPRAGATRSFEGPTWALIVAIYGGWLALTWFHEALPTGVLVVLGAWLIAWHGSLQHELTHGHPTCSARINQLLGFPPLALWMPFALYRKSHLRHHRDAHLTDPAEDPESFYVPVEDWDRMGSVERAVRMVHQTFAGRMILGPALMVGRFWYMQARGLVTGDSGPHRTAHFRIWMWHVLGVAAVLGWGVGVCGMPWTLYVFGMVYPGLSLSLVRSFAEHRAESEPARRTASVDAGPLFALLFLNNNLHVAHHARPNAPWFALPEFNRQIEGDRTAAAGAGFYPGYGTIARRFLVRPIAHPVHSRLIRVP